MIIISKSIVKDSKLKLRQSRDDKFVKYVKKPPKDKKESPTSLLLNQDMKDWSLGGMCIRKLCKR